MRKHERIEEHRELVPCGHTGCMNPSITVKKLKGWTPLCRAHYEFHIQQEANEFCRANDLTTREKQLAYIREKLGSSKLLRGVREPGEEG